jgi:hypothetical protein
MYLNKVRLCEEKRKLSFGKNETGHFISGKDSFFKAPAKREREITKYFITIGRIIEKWFNLNVGLLSR